MKRYGYLDMPKDYTDISEYTVHAHCPNCGRHIEVDREQAQWNDKLERWEADDLCSEFPDDVPDLRKDEWI